MSVPHPATLSAKELLTQCEVRRLRRGGPGGQHRNKVETAVVVAHRPTSLQAEARERRSQAENQRQAVFRLRVRLAVEIRTPVDLGGPKEPSPLWRSRTAGGRLQARATHEDFPSLLAEALDAVAAAEYDLAAAASSLAISSSQLARFLQREPVAWRRVNQARRQRGLRPLG